MPSTRQDVALILLLLLLFSKHHLAKNSMATIPTSGKEVGCVTLLLLLQAIDDASSFSEELLLL
jgi:hypothetical protein